VGWSCRQVLGNGGGGGKGSVVLRNAGYRVLVHPFSSEEAGRKHGQGGLGFYLTEISPRLGVTSERIACWPETKKGGDMRKINVMEEKLLW